MINVLMSTYNGESYIKEQLDSILGQTYPYVHIYIRDDGSVDGTCDVIESYLSNDCITFVRGDNVGYGKSFLLLLQMAAEGDYWAFCDQDDVWMPDKLERAVRQLDNMPGDQPNMYFHNFYLTDEGLNIQETYHNRISNYSFQMAITECLHLGFATVINERLRELMLRGDINKIPSHDWWAELVVMAFGNVYTDDTVLAYHRRLASSVSELGLKNRLRWLFQSLREESSVLKLGREFAGVFVEELTEENRKVIGLFAENHYHLGKAFQKCFYPKRWRSSLASEIVCRGLMLIGKM